MASIKVCREPSLAGACSSEDEYLNWGADVSNELLSTEESALERGRIEIDRQYTNRKNCNLDLHQTAFMQPGIAIATLNVEQMEVGRLNQISITVQKSGDTITAGTEATMEKNI